MRKRRVWSACKFRIIIAPNARLSHRGANLLTPLLINCPCLRVIPTETEDYTYAQTAPTLNLVKETAILYQESYDYENYLLQRAHCSLLIAQLFFPSEMYRIISRQEPLTILLFGRII